MNAREATTKERILKVAEEVFGRHGYAGATTQAIARQARVNKALIHYYFSNKAKLYQAVMDGLMFDLMKISQDVAKKNLKGPKLVEALFSEFFDYAARHRDFARLMTADRAADEREYLENSIRNLFRPLFQRGVEFLEEHRSKGTIRNINARQFMATVFLMTLSYFSLEPLMTLLFGEAATGPKVLAERKQALLDVIYATLGVQP